MSLWVPRPPAIDEPACWSWPVPPIRDVGAEIALVMDAGRALPAERRLDRETLRLIYYDPQVIRWQEFHSGGRVAEALPPRCAICGGADAGRRRVEDHCHATGQIRGLLCRRCNYREARWNGILYARYQAWHPAAILDAHEMYSGFEWTDGWSSRLHGDRVRSGQMRPPTPWPSFTDPALRRTS